MALRLADALAQNARMHTESRVNCRVRLDHPIRARLVELDPCYYDVIIERWQAEAGKQAMLDGDGRTFDEVADERLVRAVG